MCAALLLQFVSLSACMPSSTHSSTGTPSVTVNPLSRIHNVTPNSLPSFETVTFTPSTTFEQAVAILGSAPYPWDCDDPRTPVPPTTNAQRAAFSTSHTLFIEYASWNRLTHIASSPQVISVDGTALYQCS
jgi:hypothetical protein